MSYREKAEWVSLVTGVVVWGWYFTHLVGFLKAGGGAGSLIWPFVGAVAATIVIQAALMIVAALTTPRSERSLSDEREVRFAGRAMTVGYTVLTVLVLAVAWAATGPMNGLGPIQVLAPNLLVFAIVTAEALKSLVSIGQFRLGR